MYGRPTVITTLEEDLKKLGLLKEEGPETPGPKGEPSSNKAAPGRNVGAMSDDPKEDGEDETDEAPQHQGAQLPAAKLPVTPGAQKEAVAGMPDDIRAGKGAGKGKPVSGSMGADVTVSGNAKSTAEAKDDDKDDKDDEDEKEDKKDKKDKKDESRSLSVREAVARVRGESKSIDHVSELLASVSEIMESIDNTHRAESVKAFANLAIIAEMLFRGYANYAGKYEDAELAEAAEALDLMSKEARDIALALESGEEIDEDGLADEFRSQTEALVAGLDLYSDIVESDRELDEADDEDDADDKDEKKSKKDDGDEDEDDQEEAILPRSPLIRKDKMKGGGVGATTGARGAMSSSPGMRLNMSREEAYEPYGKPVGKGKKPAK